MKKLSCIMVVLLFMTFAFAINNSIASDIPKEAVKDRNGEDIQNYEAILKELSSIPSKEALNDPKTYDEDFFELEGSMGIMEVSKYGNPDKIGYTIQDINADGISELIIGEIEEKKDHSCFGSKIYAVYKQVDGKIYCALEGYDRNMYEILNDGTFFNLGSEGATHTLFGSYAIYPSRKDIACKDFYFSYEEDETCQNILYYHNTSGEFDRAVSEIISEDRFDKALNAYRKRIKPILLVPFTYALSSKANTASISVQWAEKVLDAGSPYNEFIADTSDAQVKIAFSASIGVTDFKVLKLELQNVDEDGKPTFLTEELCVFSVLRPGLPLVVGMTFWGSIPNYGISYTDENGFGKRFAIVQSGQDGSILLQEF